MHLRKWLNGLLATIIMITSSFSSGGAQETVICADSSICTGSAVEPIAPCGVPRDCHGIQQLCGINSTVYEPTLSSGLYYIYPVDGEPALQVYCDMETDEGGWLVFQRRQDGSVDFQRDWNEYKSGFGDPAGEFWLGNENLHKITQQVSYILRVDLEDFDGERRFSQYFGFEIKGEAQQFKLEVAYYYAYLGNAGNSMSYHNGQKFSTNEVDNDRGSDNCSERLGQGGWWYKSCYKSNLNGLYLIGQQDDHTGIIWRTWRPKYSLKKTEMKIKPYPVGNIKFGG